MPHMRKLASGLLDGTRQVKFRECYSSVTDFFFSSDALTLRYDSLRGGQVSFRRRNLRAEVSQTHCRRHDGTITLLADLLLLHIHDGMLVSLI